MKNKKHIAGAKSDAGLAVLCIALLFLVAPHAFATIRSPYPAKSFPPYRGSMVTTGSDSMPAPTNGR
jgi:hypothetical protein